MGYVSPCFVALLIGLFCSVHAYSLNCEERIVSSVSSLSDDILPFDSADTWGVHRLLTKEDTAHITTGDFVSIENDDVEVFDVLIDDNARLFVEQDLRLFLASESILAEAMEDGEEYDCVVEIDSCNATTCNGGVCTDLPDSGTFQYSCECPDNAFGFNCEFFGDENIISCATVDPDEVLCGAYGTCIEVDTIVAANSTNDGNVTTTLACVCDPGYYGDFCTQEIDMCVNHTCANSAECVNHRTYFECLCNTTVSDGNTTVLYVGDLCDTVFTTCEDTPLGDLACPQDKGSCVEPDIQGYPPSCECVSPYYGPQCAYFDACLSDPCQNNGVCLTNAAELTFVCVCNELYTGNTCEEFVDPGDPWISSASNQTEDEILDQLTQILCASSPCENKGVCYVDPSDTQIFRCDCQGNFEGRTCDKYIVDPSSTTETESNDGLIIGLIVGSVCLVLFAAGGVAFYFNKQGRVKFVDSTGNTFHMPS